MLDEARSSTGAAATAADAEPILGATTLFGSDLIAQLLRRLDIPHLAINPGASSAVCTTASSTCWATNGQVWC